MDDFKPIPGVLIPQDRYLEFLEHTTEGDEVRPHLSEWLTQHVGPEWLGGFTQIESSPTPTWCAVLCSLGVEFLFSRADHAALFKLTFA